jgi:hypothetical protein
MLINSSHVFVSVHSHQYWRVSYLYLCLNFIPLDVLTLHILHLSLIESYIIKRINIVIISVMSTDIVQYAVLKLYNDISLEKYTTLVC